MARDAIFSPGVNNALTWLFVGALITATATQLWLAKRQIRHIRAHRDAVPRMFAEAIPLEAHQKAADYSVTKTQLGMLEIALGAFALLAFTLGGLSTGSARTGRASLSRRASPTVWRCAQA